MEKNTTKNKKENIHFGNLWKWKKYNINKKEKIHF